MSQYQPKILFVHTFEPSFLRECYRSDPQLATGPFEQQRTRLLATGYCLADAYAHNLRALGWEAEDVIVNADPLQDQWAREHGLDIEPDIRRRRREIVSAQTGHYKPDVVYVFEWCPLGDSFLQELRSHIRLLAGQVASPLHTDRTYAAYDVMFSSWPPLVDYFHAHGQRGETLRLGFDERVLKRLDETKPDIDVSFIGGFAPSHPDRVEWLERIIEEMDVAVFGYGVENTPAHSPIRQHHYGPVWGYEMYKTLRRSKVTLNRHARIDIRGSVSSQFANNMRLYEATGVGTCLLTEQRGNLSSLFSPGHEVLTYTTHTECIAKIRVALSDISGRARVAHAGQQRTLCEHTYAHRMAELHDLILQRL